MTQNGELPATASTSLEWQDPFLIDARLTASRDERFDREIVPEPGELVRHGL